MKKPSTTDNIALFHARALRDYCQSVSACYKCIFYTEGCTCGLGADVPQLWKNIERRDNVEYEDDN